MRLPLIVTVLGSVLSDHDYVSYTSENRSDPYANESIGFDTKYSSTHPVSRDHSMSRLKILNFLLSSFQ